MKLVRAAVNMVSGPPRTKNMMSAPSIAESSGMIIMGMSAWAHFGTLR